MSAVYDVVILGGGMVGLSIANQLLQRRPSLKVAVIDKEDSLGKHNSGRNSGVLHAGIYYKPDTLKAQVCVLGARRLKQWILDHELPLNQCGKLIIPTRESQDDQLEILLERGLKNGADVDIIDSKFFIEKAPSARTATGRAIWSPGTCVTNPLLVIRALSQSLGQQRVDFYLGSSDYEIDTSSSKILLKNNLALDYGYLVNAAGVHSLEIAHQFSLGSNYKMMPFKGNYWMLKDPSKFNVTTNLYPVPDLSVPFLGIHFTPSSDGNSIYIGPTATPAFGCENYGTLENFELSTFFSTLYTLSGQYLSNKSNMRRYFHEQSIMWSKYIAINEMKRILPSITLADFVVSSKVGIRPQLFDLALDKLEDDLVCLSNSNSIHILNAISPAFTASFELADYIISSSPLCSVA